MAEGMTCRRLLYDFSLWCTLVCLNRIVTSAKWLAIVFTIIFFTMCFFFVFISTNCTIKFFKFPSSTEVSIDVKSAPFPRFSFCNENPMKRSVVNSNGPYAEIVKLLQQYEAIELKRPTADDYGLNSTKSRLQRQKRARLMLRLLMAKLTDADRFAAGYTFTELVSECTFAGETCNSADFTPFLHPEYGVCFTFNGERMIAKVGKAEGLRMLMTVNQDTPRDGTFDFMPTTDSATMWGVIYDEPDFPDFLKNGFRAGVQTQSFVALSKSSHSRMEKPYGTCTEDVSSAAEYYGNYTYTFNLCQHACLQNLAAEKCGCVDPLYPKLANQTYCSTGANMLCLISLTYDTKPATSPDGKSMCGCQMPCNYVVYDKTISNSVYPSAKYKVAAGTQAQRGVLIKDQNGGRTGQGNDDWNDYDNPPKSTTTTARPTVSVKGTTSTMPASGVVTISGSTTSPASGGITSTTTPTSSHEVTTTDARSSSTIASTSTSGTTTPAQQCSYQGPPPEARIPLASKAWCRNLPLFSDPNIIAIQGYPCTSIKDCNTCVFFSAPPSPDSFICSYTYPGGCLEKSNTGYLKGFPYESCNAFFGAFDFIPIGTSVPNISDWWLHTSEPSADPTCYSAADANECWRNSVCKTKQSSSDLSTLQNNPYVPLDKSFIAALKSSTTPCEMATLALDAAKKHYNPIGKRKKRDSSTSTAVVDVPGWGSCEYANKNFKGAQECIQWYQRNGLLVHIYFDRLQMENYTQGATYPLVALISDISGHAGLWLGMSVVTVVELIGLVFMCFNCIFCGRKIKLPNKDEIKKEADKREGRPPDADSASSE